MTSEISCPKCGTFNLVTAPRCRLCGQSLQISKGDAQICPECGSTGTPVGQDRCITCGWNLGPPRAPQKAELAVEPEKCEHTEDLPIHTQRMAMVDVAGVLIMVAGALGIIHGFLAAMPVTSGDILPRYENIIPQGKLLDDVLRDYLIVSIMMFLAGILAVGMSMSAFRRTNYYVATAGAVFGILSVGFLLGAFFALIGLILLAVSRKSFLPECR